MQKRHFVRILSIIIVIVLCFQTLPVYASPVEAGDLRGVWEGTYTGYSGGTEVERTIRLDVDYASGGRLEGIATIDGGSNGRYLFSGSYSDDGLIRFQGTQWIENPSNFSFVEFTGVYSSADGRISGYLDGERSFSLQKTAGPEDFSGICGVWEGTYTGHSNGSPVERTIRVEIAYAALGKLTGIATIDGGANGRYLLEGSYGEDAAIRFMGTKWILNPSGFGFAEFSGVYDADRKLISGNVDGDNSKSFSLSKTADTCADAQMELNSIPGAWDGEYDGRHNSTVVRRLYEIHIQSVEDDGTIRGNAIFAPSDKADAVYGANGSYFFQGKIDARYGTISLQGYEWIDYPDSSSYDNWSFVKLDGYFDFSSGAQIHGRSEDGIWEMTAINYDEINRISGFTLGRDNNNFVHTSSSGRANAGFRGLRDYAIDDAYFQQLTRNSSRGEKNRIKKDMQEKWGGSCYGIAMSMGLLYEGYIGIGDLTNADGKDSYYSLDYPCSDRKFLNMINYFQLSQGLENGGKESAAISAAYNHGIFTGLVNWFSGYDSLPVFLKKLVNYCASDHVELLGFSTEDSGHAVLVTGCVFDAASGTYQVEIYDENCIGFPGDIGEFSYMTVAKDFSDFSYTDANGDVIDSETYTSIYFLDWSSLGSILAPVSSDYSGHTRISFPIGSEIRIENASGQYLEYDGSVFRGDIPVYGVDTEEYDEGSRFVIETSNTGVLKVSETGDVIDVEAYSDEDFLSLRGTDVDSAVLDMDRGISMSGSDYRFEAFISTEQLSDDENGLISLSAGAESDVELLAVGSAVSVASAGALTDVCTGAYVGAKASTKRYTDTGSAFVIGDTAGIDGATEVIEPEFADVDPDAYYAQAVKWAVSLGITNGTSDTTFSPEMNVTRGQAVTFLWRAMGRPAPASSGNPFADVSSDAWYYDAVLWAVEQGITNGTGPAAFEPNDNVTRGQMITFLYRTMGEPGKTGEGPWYADAENWAGREGLLADTAVPYTTNGDCPRSDVVFYLWRALS